MYVSKEKIVNNFVQTTTCRYLLVLHLLVLVATCMLYAAVSNVARKNNIRGRECRGKSAAAAHRQNGRQHW